MDRTGTDIELREQLAALVRTAVDAIITIDSRGRVRLCNPAVERMFGWPAEDLIGERLSVLMPDGHAQHHDEYMPKYLNGGEPHVIGSGRRVQGKRRDGSTFPMYVSVGEFNAGGERCFVGILRDLSEADREHARLRQLEDQLAVMGRRSAVSEIGASLAHELNQPLAAIDLFLAAAERALPGDPDQAQALFDDARKEVQRAGSIIKRIRKMERGGDPPRTLFALGPAIEDAIELCRVSDTSNPAEIDVTGVEGVMVFGDEVQIRQVLVNLIKNALEATSQQEQRVVRIEVKHEQFVTIDVLDNGPGVEESDAENLFKPFHSTKSDGLGLGLSISKAIAEKHGGELLYLMSSGTMDGRSGACFRLRLPDGQGNKGPGDA